MSLFIFLIDYIWFNEIGPWYNQIRIHFFNSYLYKIQLFNVNY